MTLLSAHRCGAETDRTLENTREAIELATYLGAEFIEFDVQRCADGVFVLFHDDHVEIDGELVRLADLPFARLAEATHQFIRYDDALAILAARGKHAHIDLKFVSPDELYADPSSTYEVVAARLAVEIMGADQIIITSLEDASVRAIRAWARERYPHLLVGLSLGRDLTGRRRQEVIHTRLRELFPRTRIRESGANLVVANKQLARWTLARFAAKRRLPLLVWTVDNPKELERWIRDPRTWLVTTNYPARALRIREERRSRRPGLRRLLGRRRLR